MKTRHHLCNMFVCEINFVAEKQHDYIINVLQNITDK